MALPSTIFKANFQISDLNRNYYSDHRITIARHPSENDERLLVRIVSFLLNATEKLQFGKGLSVENEPALVAMADNGEITLWIDVGLPEEKNLKKAVSKSKEVKVYTYGDRKIRPWLERNLQSLKQLSGISYFQITDEAIEQLMPLLSRNINWSVLVLENNEISVTNEKHTVHIQVNSLNLSEK